MKQIQVIWVAISCTPIHYKTERGNLSDEQRKQIDIHLKNIKKKCKINSSLKNVTPAMGIKKNVVKYKKCIISHSVFKSMYYFHLNRGLY